MWPKLLHRDRYLSARRGQAAGMEYVLPFAAFLALYCLFWRRAGKPPVQWGRLALIIGLAAAVLLISAL